MIKVKNLNLEGVCLLDIPLYKDNRGTFIETYTGDVNNKLNIDFGKIYIEYEVHDSLRLPSAINLIRGL